MSSIIYSKEGECVCGNSDSFDGDSFDGSCISCSSEQLSKLSPSDIQQLSSSEILQNLPLLQSSGKSKLFNSNQLKDIPTESLNDFGNYDSEALTQALKLKGYKINKLSGDLSGVHFINDIFVFPDGSKIDAKTGDNPEIKVNNGAIDFYSDPQLGIAFSNAQNVKIDGKKLTADKIGQLEFNGANAQVISGIDADLIQKKISFASVDIVFVGSTSLKQLIASTLTLSNGQIKDATLFTSKNDNQFTLYCNGIPFDGSFSQQQEIKVNCTTEEGKQIESFTVFTKKDFQTGIPTKVSISTTKNSHQLSWENTETESSFKITDLKEFTVKDSIFNFTTSDFIEQLIGNCDYSSVEVRSEGFTKLTLKPTVTLCAGACYTFLDKQLKEKSFELCNSGKQDYLIGFQKGITPSTFYAELEEKNRIGKHQNSDESLKNKNFDESQKNQNTDEFSKEIALEQYNPNNYGFIEDNSPQKKTKLNGIISYNRFLSRKEVKLSDENYNKAELPFQEVYESFDTNTTTTIIYDDEKIRVSLTNTNPLINTINTNVDQTKTILSQINSGFFTFLEEKENIQNDNNNNNPTENNNPSFITRFAFNTKENYPDYITIYDAFVTKQKPQIKIEDKTAIIKSTNAQGEETQVILTTPQTSNWSTIRTWFFASASETLEKLISALKEGFSNSKIK